MGKIQSAITGALMSAIGAVGVHSKMKASAENAKLQQENESIENEGKALFGEAYEGADENERNNLITRQDEANQIAQSYAKSRRFQKEALEQRIAQIGGISTPEGKKLLEAGKTAQEKLLEQSKNKMMELKHPKEGK